MYPWILITPPGEPEPAGDLYMVETDDLGVETMTLVEEIDVVETEDPDVPAGPE